ncbi:mannose-1-phosphate guanylyltransferase/mannose-6-phosphate isomerase [Pacificimonas sp. WHA3]|uniref:Mannose-1-phosphate guanylyltransferase/mannose-6-phosphate isomerase n=1 Tax=Pacificimonas pallii TaxID=2827236 RepID=A0ABS6SDX4_9SPHN|nr:mannose-1-phosphate guanylyltransferase/mannose-6-phosphate isomerase [Pacificimonas pallii]MBV7256612.1 mannose-1-phosphate guanylyltransferase/mannose-6-phosphate isomerase [Pacificimonas pallii]
MTTASPSIWPVILSGGSGTRLWPLSRALRPKQMLHLGQQQSMIAATAARTNRAEFAAPVIVAGAAHESLVTEALQGTALSGLILEPAARNTAPAIALAAHMVAQSAADGLMLVMPSDHLIADEAAFHAAIAAAVPAANEGWLVTFGIEPDRPETGYGYIEAAEDLSGKSKRVRSFKEKPELAVAEAYVNAGGYYWNAGIFLMRADSYLQALERHAADIARESAAAWAGRTASGNVIRPDASHFAACASQSIDYAIMEPAERKAVVPVTMGWSDIGGFDALHGVLPQDADGNALMGDAIAKDCSGSLVWGDGILAAAVGLDNIVLIATGDAVVALPRDRAQDVKLIVEELKAANRPETESPPKER